MLPPPAPTSAMSIAGTRRRKPLPRFSRLPCESAPPISNSPVRLSSPPSMTDAFAVVPPMSMLIAFGRPIRRASSAVAITPGRRPRLDHVDRAPPAARGRHDAAVRLHDQDRRADAEPAQLRLEAPEVAAHDRHDVGVRHRRARPLELAHLGQDLRGEGQQDAGRPLADDRRRGLLVGAARVRVEERDRDRLHALAREEIDGRRDARPDRAASGSPARAEPLRDLAPPAPRDEGRRPLEVDVVEPRQPEPPDLQEVAEARRREEPRRARPGARGSRSWRRSSRGSARRCRPRRCRPPPSARARPGRSPRRSCRWRRGPCA